MKLGRSGRIIESSQSGLYIATAEADLSSANPAQEVIMVATSQAQPTPQAFSDADLESIQGIGIAGGSLW